MKQVLLLPFLHIRKLRLKEIKLFWGGTAGYW